MHVVFAFLGKNRWWWSVVEGEKKGILCFLKESGGDSLFFMGKNLEISGFF